MSWPAFVVVRQNEYPPTAKMLGMFRRPFSSTAGIARRQQIDTGQIVNVLFAFNDEDKPFRIGQQFRQAIRPVAYP